MTDPPPVRKTAGRRSMILDLQQARPSERSSCAASTAGYLQFREESGQAPWVPTIRAGQTLTRTTYSSTLHAGTARGQAAASVARPDRLAAQFDPHGRGLALGCTDDTLATMAETPPGRNQLPSRRTAQGTSRGSTCPISDYTASTFAAPDSPLERARPRRDDPHLQGRPARPHHATSPPR